MQILNNIIISIFINMRLYELIKQLHQHAYEMFIKLLCMYLLLIIFTYGLYH